MNIPLSGEASSNLNDINTFHSYYEQHYGSIPRRLEEIYEHCVWLGIDILQVTTIHVLKKLFDCSISNKLYTF